MALTFKSLRYFHTHDQRKYFTTVPSEIMASNVISDVVYHRNKTRKQGSSFLLYLKTVSRNEYDFQQSTYPQRQNPRSFPS